MEAREHDGAQAVERAEGDARIDRQLRDGVSRADRIRIDRRRGEADADAGDGHARADHHVAAEGQRHEHGDGRDGDVVLEADGRAEEAEDQHDDPDQLPVVADADPLHRVADAVLDGARALQHVEHRSGDERDDHDDAGVDDAARNGREELHQRHRRGIDRVIRGGVDDLAPVHDDAVVHSRRQEIRQARHRDDDQKQQNVGMGQFFIPALPCRLIHRKIPFPKIMTDYETKQ